MLLFVQRSNPRKNIVFFISGLNIIKADGFINKHLYCPVVRISVMLKPFVFFACAILLTKTTMAQAPSTRRYRDVVFSDIGIDKDQSYNPDAPNELKKAYLFDLYQPKGDESTTARPLIIWMHGGGFKYGSKTSKGVKVWSKSFAQRGYVCASINYRLGSINTLLHFDDMIKAAFYATQDAKMAVAYFRKNAAKYQIDPNKIILGGNSADRK